MIYHFVLCAVRGKYSQTTLTGSGKLKLVDGELKVGQRLRVLNETALLVLARRFLRDESNAGITIRKVIGAIKPGTVERESLQYAILLPKEVTE